VRRGTILLATLAAIIGSHAVLASDIAHSTSEDGILPSFVRPNHGAKACWSAEISAAKLASDKTRTVKSIALSMETAIAKPDVDWPKGRVLYNYELSIEFAKGRRGRALGNCLPDGNNAIICGVECDGGSAVVTHADVGAINVDFERSGGIKLHYCGEPGKKLRFRPTPFEYRFQLQRRPEAECPAVTIPDWDAGID